MTRTVLVLAWGLLACLPGCGTREMTITFDLDDCGSDLQLVRVYIYRAEPPSLCQLAGPKSLSPTAELEVDNLSLTSGMAVRVVAVGVASLSSSRCLCATPVGGADLAVGDDLRHTVRLADSFIDCSVPRVPACD